MTRRLLVAAMFSSLLAAPGCGSGPGSPLEGTWRAVLTTPGGELPFLLEIHAQGALIRNGPEVVPFSSVERDGSQIVLRMEGYDSAIHATWEKSGAFMTGEWIRTRPEGEQDRLPFTATAGETRRFLPAQRPVVPGAPASVTGAWAVLFTDEDGQEPARGEFTQEGHIVTGTFLTPSGDYRSLLLAGVSDKAAASATLPDLTALLAYPTTIFVGRDGRVRNIHSGFEGPGTGEHHEKLVARMEAILRELLAEPAPPAGS